MKIIAASMLVFILLPTGTQAQTAYAINKVCKFDIEQYCRSIPKTRIRDLKECLAKHEKDLFPNCQDHYKIAK
ncbi:MAG: hypothetical protein ACLPPF_03390 [Rhodomicrobium sp.]